MNLNEQQFVRTLVRHMREGGWHVQRIEDKYSTGIPDINACKNGQEIWLEAKVFRWPKRKTSCTRIGIRDGQQTWARLRCKAGGECFLIAKELATKQAYLFDWHDFMSADLHPFALTKEELESKAVHQGTTANITRKIQGDEHGV